MKYPDFVYSHDLENNCIIVIQWGKSGYYETDFRKRKYPINDVVDYMNEIRGITQAEREAMELCSMAAQNNPNLDWEQHYETIMNKLGA